jgi:hypothetical protein
LLTVTGATSHKANIAQALAASPTDLELPARYEVHLDRKLERTLATLSSCRSFGGSPCRADPFGKTTPSQVANS